MMDDGCTKKAHLLSAYNQTGVKSEELAEQPELKKEVIHLWEDFLALTRRRGGNGSGPNPLDWEKVMGWERRTGARLRDWELEALFKVDDAYLAETAAAVKGGS